LAYVQENGSFDFFCAASGGLKPQILTPSSAQ
jgi:hypothetical protein